MRPPLGRVRLLSSRRTATGGDALRDRLGFGHVRWHCTLQQDSEPVPLSLGERRCFINRTLDVLGETLGSEVTGQVSRCLVVRVMPCQGRDTSTGLKMLTVHRYLSQGMKVMPSAERTGMCEGKPLGPDAELLQQ